MLNLDNTTQNTSNQVAAEQQPLEIIYQDEHLVAINKPSGLLVHRSHIDPHETEFAVQHLRDQIQQYVYPVHRLDKPTSGILLFALNEQCAQLISQQFLDHSINKQYLAVVRGYTARSGHINHPLKVIRDKIADKHKSRDKPPQEAITDYQTLAQIELPYKVEKYPTSRYSLVRLKPKTGRKHQLRRHMKHISHPIIGDPKYGRSAHNRFFAEHFDCKRLMLHAEKLELLHPIINKKIMIDANVPKIFHNIFQFKN